MLINARDPRQWTYLRNLPQIYFLKTLVLTLGSPPEKGGRKKKKNSGINSGQRHFQRPVLP
jgi:hypothetical protein